MAFGKWELDGQTGLNLWRSALFGQEEVTHIVSRFKDKKGHCGGMLIAHGSEPQFMEPSLFVLKKEIPTHSLSQSVKHPFFLVINAPLIYFTNTS
jgi:hypothetical protein